MKMRLENIDLVARQRNVFIAISMIALSTSCFLAIKLLNINERIVLVPGLQSEVWINDAGVSASYLEEVSAMYLQLLLDLELSSIDWKKERIMAHVSHQDESHMKGLIEYFASVKEKCAQFSLSTHFALKKLETNPKNLSVKASGRLISRFGTGGFQSVPANYLLSFEWLAGKLLLKEFVQYTEKNKNGND